jgi:ribonuclease E
MTKKMLINTDHPEECRVVIVEDGKLEEFIVEHAAQERLKGNVYEGVISRVEPAFEAAFVDFGGKKFGFLPFKDVRKESYAPTREKKAKVRIQDVLFRGQKIMVQVVKEERDNKGPTLTNFLSIPGRFLVLMCGNAGGGVSRKIEDESERKKLKEIISGFDLPESMGVIIRTAGMGRTKIELQKDLQMLMKIWETIDEQTNDSTDKPKLLYQVPDMVVRTVRDHYTADTSEIVVDCPATHKTLRAFFKLVMPRNQGRVKLYNETKPLLAHYGMEKQIENIYKRRVELPSGGSLVIDSGEALVAVDVNSGKTTSASELEETALRTNLEAADEIGRQLRLRDLGGLVVIDFIDMFQKRNKTQVEKEIKQACKKDKARINLSRISKFGLLEMSRQRLSPAIGEGAFDRCQSCEGSGFIRSKGALAIGVLRNIQEVLAAKNVKTMEVAVSLEVVSYLLNHKTIHIMKLEEKHQIKINFRGQAGLSFDDFSYIVTEQKDEKALEGKTKEPRHSKRAPRAPRVPRESRESKVETKAEAKAETTAETKVDPNQAIKDTPKNEGEQLAVPVEELDQPAKEAGEEDKETAPRTKRPRRKYVRRSPNSRKPGPPRGRRRRKPESENSTQTGTEGSTQGEGTSEQPQAASEQPKSSDGNFSSSGENRVETPAPSVVPVESIKPTEKIVKKDDFQPPPISSTTEERAVE